MRARHPEHRPDIDGLRAIAVMSVVGYHAFPSWVPGGFVGVDVFFVLSGYLISRILFAALRRDELSLAGFYGRRIRRIFPSLAVVMGSTYVLGWFVLLPGEYKELGKEIAAGAGFAVNLTSWNEAGYFDALAETKPLLHLWSLGVEEQYYLVWPVLLLLFGKRLGILRVTVALAMGSFALNVATVATHPIAAFYSPLTRFWELLVGGVLASLTLERGEPDGPETREPSGDTQRAAPLHFERARVRDLQATLGLTLLAASVVVVNPHRAFPGLWALLPTAGTAMVIAAGPSAGPNRTFLSNRGLVLLGLISYPLYLWHWSLLSFGLLMENRVPSAASRGSLLALALVLSWLTYAFIEAPIRAAPHAAGKTATLVALVGFLGCLGYRVYARGGFPGRLDPLVRHLVAFEYDPALSYRYGACFLRPDQKFAAFSACPEAANRVPRKTIVLWGDSFAAHLYPGYEARFGREYSIVQRTSSSCPPILDLDPPERPNCRSINARILELISAERPGVVVLAANWSTYEWASLAGTVSRLHDLGIANIDIVGPVPRWRSGLPRQLIRFFYQDALHRVPGRMAFGLDEEANRLDGPFGLFVQNLRARYISPIAILCDADGCVTRVDDESDGLTAWDTGHLTAKGSRFLVSHFPPP